MALNRTDLDRAQASCGHNAEELFFHGRCHPMSPTWASYKDGVVTVRCATCQKMVAAIEVAAGKPS